MSARAVIAESAITGFEYGFIVAIFTFIQSKGDIKKSATCGAAVFVGVAAFDISLSFFIPKSERPLFKKSADDDESDTEDK